ncbi:hypothetical protein KY343_04165 [Candidatus Woesearchaeota archaeon]|nr:hypothetical protein [Candidatus Woesearchaeota archaeon]
MSLKNLLGLTDISISDCEIMAKVAEAKHKGLSEIEFIKTDGSAVKIELPMIGFDPHMDIGS